VFWKNLIQQSPYFRQKFDNFKSFSKATKDEYLLDEVFQKSSPLQVNQEKSVLIENLGSLQFFVKPLNDKAQWGPVNSILVDSTLVSKTQVFMIGNDLGGNPFEGNQHAFLGLILTTTGEDFEYIESHTLGMDVLGHATDIEKINLKSGKELIVVVQNNGKLKALIKTDP
jgi:hypothetical protein